MSHTVTDAELAATYWELIQTKRAEAEQLPDAIRTMDRPSGGRLNIFVMGGPNDAVKVVYSSPDGYSRLQFANKNNKPVYDVSMSDTGVLTVDHRGNVDEIPSLSDKLALAASLTVSTNELVPYGYIVDGQVVAVIYHGDMYYATNADGVLTSGHGLNSFVLTSPGMPVDLKMVSNDTGWTKHVWELIRDGKLVRLSERINNLPQEVWYKQGSNELPYLEFEASDGQTPAFVARMPYVKWHPQEAHPGELFPAGFYQPSDHDVAMRGYFR